MKKKLIASKVQSELSIERTVLANRRTFLAYFRTAVALIVAGAGLLKFVQNSVWVYLGIAFVILTPVVMIMGIYDYVQVKNLIKRERELLEAQYSEESAETETQE